MQIIENAVKHYGTSNQIQKAIEELAELIVELARKEDKNAIADEIADVEIVIAQCKIMFDIANQVEVRKNYKLERLKKRMEEQKWIK